MIVRKKEVYDGAVPSGNSVMAYNLYRLSIYFDKPEWKERSLKMVSSLGRLLPGILLLLEAGHCLLLEIITGTDEIAILGKDYQRLHKELLDNLFLTRY